MPSTLNAPSPEIHKEWADILLDKATTVADAEVDAHGIGGLVYKEGISNKQILFVSPRDTAKSTMIGAGYALYHSIYFRENTYVVLQCKTLGEAKKRLRKIANVFNYSDEFKVAFGYCGEDSKGVVTWREDKIIIRTYHPLLEKMVEWTFEAKGYGQPTRGLKEDDQRVTLYIGDDVEDEENTKTEEAMDKNFNRFLSIKAGIHARGKQIVIGTPIHQLCLVVKLQEMTGWVTKVYHTIDEENKTSIWPERLTYEDMMTEKEGLESVHKSSYYYSERQCLITGNEDQTFQESDLRWWDGYFALQDGFGVLHITHLGDSEEGLRLLVDKDGLAQPEVVSVNTHLGIDPASSVSKRADYSVTLPNHYDRKERQFIGDYFEKRVRPTDHKDDIVLKALKYRPVRTNVESVGYQEALRDMLKRETVSNPNLRLPGITIKWQTGAQTKDERLESLEDFTREHKVYLKRGMTRMKDEMLLFPRGRKNILDAWWYSVRKLIMPNHTAIKKVAVKRQKEETLNWMIA